MKKGAFYLTAGVGCALVLGMGCKSQKPVGLTSIPKMDPIVKTVTVPGPSTGIPGGGTGGGIPGGGTPGGGNNLGGTTIVEIPPENGALGNNFNGNQTEDRDFFLAQMVHFEFDSSVVRSDDMEKLQVVARYLLQNPTHMLKIEGHCDERGTEDYNTALGERRALSVMDELVRLGIDGSRIRTHSMGEKIPIASGFDEASFAQNRRGEFVLLRPLN